MLQFGLPVTHNFREDTNHIELTYDEADFEPQKSHPSKKILEEIESLKPISDAWFRVDWNQEIKMIKLADSFQRFVFPPIESITNHEIECLPALSLRKTKEFQDYILKNNNNEELDDIETFLFDRFDIQGRFQDLGLELVIMKLFDDPEDGSVDPEIDLYFMDKSSIDDIKLSLDLEEEIKRYFAKKSKDVEEFKKKVLNFRRYRIIFKDITST